MVTQLLLMWLLPASAVAKWPFTVYSTNEGLAQSVVYTLFQDSRGYLWIGTQAGVSRFDGRIFVNYSTDDGLSHNVVRDVVEDASGTLFFATERGICRYDGRQFHPVLDRDGNGPQEVRCLAIDKQGVLWGGSYQQGLFYFKDNRFVFVETPDYTSGVVRALHLSENGRLWVGFYGDGLGYYENNQWHSLAHLRNNYNETVRDIFENEDGSILFGTNYGAYLYKDNTIQEYLVGDRPLRTACTDIERDRQGNMWFGTSRRGAVRLSGDSTENFSIEEGMPTDGVQCILVDHEGNTWFGTYGGGVCRLGTTRFRNYTTQNGFPYPNVNAIFQDRSGAIWLGTNGGGITKLENGTFTLYDEKDGLVDDKILCLNQDHEGRIWIGTLRGISIYDKGQFSPIREQDGLPHNTVYCIEPSQDGNIYIATLEGLGIWNKGQIVALNSVNGFPHNRIEVVADYPERASLLVGTARGLVYFKDGLVERILTAHDGLLDDFINDIYVQSANRIWVATPRGLCLVENDRITTYSTIDGLSAPICYAMVEGEPNVLWVGTNNGLNRFRNGQFTAFSFRDGLASNEINPRAAIKDQAGNLWFGTPNGVTVFRNLEKSPTLTPPYINLNSVTVLGQERNLDQLSRLASNENYLEFNFTGISFVQSNNLLYAYKLEGMDPDWIQTTHQNASYAALPPGTYTFKVKARNGDGVWSTYTAEVPIEIIPPFYKSLWFFGLVLAAVLGILWARWHAFKLQARALEAKVRERTHELARSNAELERLALRDQLTQTNNRHYLDLIMETEYANLKRTFFDSQESATNRKETLGFIMFDLDYFKMINDAYTHAVGDKVLRAITHMIRPMVRESDVLVRWGGEEFLILLRSVYPEKIGELSERLRLKVESTRIPVDLEQPVQLTISLGYCHFPTDWNPNEYYWTDIVHLADLALYQAKRRGRNQTVGFMPTPEILERLDEVKRSGDSVSGLESSFIFLQKPSAYTR
ncbi:MAG: diguanylate cyclase [Acidobacteria bacterium]|nr:diguanylate cyclase [Acidobacteriota bacterium]MCB9398945.1 diguanylate cyclase [Acidobacteriota bacterium]